MKPYGAIRTYHGCRTEKKLGKPIIVIVDRPKNRKRERAMPIEIEYPEL